MFFKQQEKDDKAVEEKFQALPEEKQMKLTAFMKRSDRGGGNQNAVFELKAKIQELQEELMSKEK